MKLDDFLLVYCSSSSCKVSFSEIFKLLFSVFYLFLRGGFICREEGLISGESSDFLNVCYGVCYFFSNSGGFPCNNPLD